MQYDITKLTAPTQPIQTLAQLTDTVTTRLLHGDAMYEALQTDNMYGYYTELIYHVASSILFLPLMRSPEDTYIDPIAYADLQEEMQPIFKLMSRIFDFPETQIKSDVDTAITQIPIHDLQHVLASKKSLDRRSRVTENEKT